MLKQIILRGESRMQQKLKRKVLEDVKKEKKWTNAKLAEKLGYSRSSLHRIIKGERSPGARFIANLLKLKPDCNHVIVVFSYEVERVQYNQLF